MCTHPNTAVSGKLDDLRVVILDLSPVERSNPDDDVDVVAIDLVVRRADRSIYRFRGRVGAPGAVKIVCKNYFAESASGEIVVAASGNGVGAVFRTRVGRKYFCRRMHTYERPLDPFSWDGLRRFLAKCFVNLRIPSVSCSEGGTLILLMQIHSQILYNCSVLKSFQSLLHFIH